MALPFLPGNSFNKNLGKDKYHKSHYFDHKNETPFLFGDNKPGIGGDPLPGQRVDPPNSKIPPGEGSRSPAWVAFDKQVLSFDAYFQESVQERREEQCRVRHCKIYFYLEDDSIQVIEARLKNSGLPQGTLVRRHRIPKPAPNDNRFFTVEDFNVGQNITFYGKTFRITGCDQFTENFLRKLGVRIGLPETQPGDPYADHRKALDESMQPLRPYERHDTLRQFLDHDRHVLRFFCCWDDTDSLYGENREMVLHYFLSDDTVEIREVVKANSGRDAAPCFLRRQPLPKNVEDLRQPGELCDRTVLNVFGEIQGGRYILDNLKTGTVKVEFYTDKDLTVGSCINVFGRKFLLCDCDEFTREYYSTKYGITEFHPVTCKKPTGGACASGDSGAPYNGFGSEEDSMANTKGLIPAPPRKNIVQLIDKDKKGLESNVLRFLARLVTDKAIDKDRRFIVNFFLSDDSILVFEPPQRNSGFQGGKFLERIKLPKPGHERFSTKAPEYYQAYDFYVGAVLEINKFKMEILDADEYAYKYMESNPDYFLVANVNRVMEKLRRAAQGHCQELQSAFAAKDPNDSKRVSYQDFRCVLDKLAKCGNFVEHELITVARFYGYHPPEEVDAIVLLGSVQAHLRKHNFELFNRLKEAAQHYDTESSGSLPSATLVTVCRTVGLPVPADLLRATLGALAESTSPDGDSCVNYCEFVDRINWRDRPLPPPPDAVAQSAKAEDSWAPGSGRQPVQFVQCCAFLSDLSGGAAC
ncbi:hypothetical protein BOX15_Mlig019168g1 [Macrostomum lignano]|uniref:EF-hand domain-containing family member C2 n=1 Tax=Macrostomum lignano TaxID=282301 RepID=A0A267GCI2_9PLAT|nr:hypothetical protein BOX15_Mlig019168g1 [Macrostomum lignano]